MGKTEKEKAKKAALKKELQETKDQLKESKHRIAELEQEKEDERYKYEKLMKEKEFKAAENFNNSVNKKR